MAVKVSSRKHFFRWSSSVKGRLSLKVVLYILYFLTIQVIKNKACQIYDFSEVKTISQAWLPLFTGYKHKNISLFVVAIQKSGQIWYATFPVLRCSTLVI